MAVTVRADRPTLGWRILPPVLWGARRGHRLIERNVYVYRRTYMIILSGFFEPVFYLVSIRLGLGTLVGDVQVGGTTVSYAEFVAPALLATSAMNGAIYDSTMNVFFKLKYAHIYDAVLATPMGVGDVAVGEIGWALIRGAIYATGFLTVMVAMGLTGSVWAIACLPAALLIGFAFAAVGLAGCSYARTWSDFTWVETITVPLFLFSATFYPLSVYSPAAQWIVRATPLYHGVELMRAATLDQLECHVTTINPGEAPHAPHQHPDEELIIIKEGSLEAMQNGVMKTAGAGSIIFEASNQLHGLRNVGKTPATYYVVKWFSPGLKPRSAAD
jgi:lipooligosaccharide transport system permease protein